MTKQNFDINKLRVASPCSVGWETMSGDERVRHCHSCKLNIYNISEMTKSEVENLIANREGRLCIRLYKRADGTVLTKDCPVGLHAYYKKTARLAGATLTAILGLFSISFAQNDKKLSANDSKAKIVRTVSKENILSGTVFDHQGAVIPGKEIKVYQKDNKRIFKTISDSNGEYKIESLSPGVYTLEIDAQGGFSNYKILNLKVNDDEKIQMDITLGIISVVNGIFLEDPLIDGIDTSSSGTTTRITRGLIDKIPH